MVAATRMNIATGAGHRVRLGYLWTMMLTTSAFPVILWQETTGLPASNALLLAKQALLVVGVVAAFRVPVLRPTARTALWLTLFSLGWTVAVPLLRGSDAWASWRADVSWPVQQLVVQALLLVFSGLVAATLPRGGLRGTLVGLGRPAAPARRDPLLLNLRGSTWRLLGPLWAVPITLTTLAVMVLVYGPSPEALAALPGHLPLVLLAAALNTFNEEWQFRNVAFAHTVPLMGRSQALLYTSVLFGLAHFYGNPPGYAGVLLAGWLGYVMGKSMLETRGSTWAWLIHFLQDVVIFSFLAVMLS